MQYIIISRIGQVTYVQQSIFVLFITVSLKHSLHPAGGIQALETMLFTLDHINRFTALLPNISVGTFIHDDCDQDSYGLEKAVDFIKGK